MAGMAYRPRGQQVLDVIELLQTLALNIALANVTVTEFSFSDDIDADSRTLHITYKDGE